MWDAMIHLSGCDAWVVVHAWIVGMHACMNAGSAMHAQYRWEGSRDRWVFNWGMREGVWLEERVGDVDVGVGSVGFSFGLLKLVSNKEGWLWVVVVGGRG